MAPQWLLPCGAYTPCMRVVVHDLKPGRLADEHLAAAIVCCCCCYCPLVFCLQDAQLATFMNTAHRQIKSLEDTVKELQKF